VAFDRISFTTDYGLDDGFVAACEGVIAGIAPAVRVLHVTHTVAPRDVRRGAAVLAATVPYLPPAVHLAVVDPGVGTARRGVVLLAGESALVGPDNGLLLSAADALGGVRAAHELTAAEYRLPVVSRTFHGRDVFAPAAAHLALGVPAAAFGPALDPAGLVRLPPPLAEVTADGVRTEVGTVDRFGNLSLATDLAVPAGTGVTVVLGDRRHPATAATTFGDVEPGALLVFTDSAGRLAVAVRDGSAAEHTGATAGDEVSVLFRSQDR